MRLPIKSSETRIEASQFGQRNLTDMAALFLFSAHEERLVPVNSIALLRSIWLVQFVTVAVARSLSRKTSPR
jgi:hypothetical protein